MNDKDVAREEAIELLTAAAAVAGNAAMRRLLERAGAVRSMGMMREVNLGLSLSLVRGVKEDKSYRLIAGANGGKCTWEEFCPEYLGVTSRHIDELLETERELGAGFVAAAERAGVRRSDVRLLLSGPVEIRGEVREIIEAPEGADADRLRQAVDALVGQLAEEQDRRRMEVERLTHVAVVKDGEIKKRRADAAKLEDRLRAKDRQIRELESGWVPSEEEDGAVKEIARLTAQVAGCLIRIGEQVRAVPESHAVIDQARGATQSVLNLNDDLRGLVHEVATGGEKEKRNGR